MILSAIKTLSLVALIATPAHLAADASPIGQWNSDGQAAVSQNGPITVLPRRDERRDRREERRDGFLPADCLISVDAGARDVRLFEASCLRSKHIETRELPSNCAVTIRSGGDRVRGYDPTCLRDEGYRMAGR